MTRRVTITASLEAWCRLANTNPGKVARRLRAGTDPFDAVWRERWAKVSPRQEQQTMTTDVPVSEPKGAPAQARSR